MLFCIMDAQEGLEGATVDIPGASLHATTDKEVIMCIDGTMADLLVKIYQKIQPFPRETEWEASHLYTAQESSLRHSQSCATFLKKTLQQAREQMELQAQPIRSLRRQQNNRWETVHGTVAIG